MNEIVDMQVNVGDTAFGPNCDFETYEENALALGFTRALVFPTPTEIRPVLGGKETNCLWRTDAEPNERYYVQRDLVTGTERDEQPVNPYRQANERTLAFVKEYNARKTGMRLYLAAKLHPHLDDEQALEGLLDEDVASLKIHGIATHSDPQTFPKRFNEILRHHGLPIVVHTDWYRGVENTDASPMQRTLIELCKSNNPLAYVRWAIENKLRVCINHGARLHAESIHIINNEPDLSLAYGPDSHLDARQDHLAVPTGDYAATLFEMARPDKVMFSTDYRWNIDEDGAWDDLRWDSVERIRRLLSTDNQEKVLATNAIEYYGLDR